MSFIPRLQELRDQLRRSNAIDPETLGRFQSLTADLKSAVEQATKETNAKARAVAGELRAKAKEVALKVEALKAPPPDPFVQPWEEHQGLTPDHMDGLVAAALDALTFSPAPQTPQS